jgi:hypothetical protein
VNTHLLEVLRACLAALIVAAYAGGLVCAFSDELLPAGLGISTAIGASTLYRATTRRKAGKQ